MAVTVGVVTKQEQPDETRLSAMFCICANLVGFAGTAGSLLSFLFFSTS